MMVSGIEIPDAFLAVQALLTKASEVNDHEHRQQCIGQAEEAAKRAGLRLTYRLPTKGAQHVAKS